MLRCLALLVLLATPVLAQDQDPAQTLAKFRVYLDRRPFHEAAFDRMVDSAVSIDGLSELIAEYEAAASDSAATREQRIVLARLYAATERSDEALGMLAELDGDETELFLLRGRLALDAGDHGAATQALDEAASRTEDLRLLEQIHQARGEARLAAADPDGARAAFEDLAQLDPESFHLRFLAADALSAAGLADDAIAAYLAAGELAGEDTARRCRALAAAGGLLEAADRADEAITLYDSAIDLMSRGNWLKRDLLARVVGASRRAGSLAALAEDLAGRDASDLDRRELYAQVLVELRRVDEATAVLRSATEDYPDDLPLGRKLLELYADGEDVDARVAEYQRLIEAHPAELELYLELGALFAGEGRLEQARLQWQRTLEQRLDDASLCVRLSALYALHGMHDEALGTLERALELEPAEQRHYAEMAAVLVRADRRDDLPALLDRAEAAAGDHAARLEEYADLARGLRFDARARAALTQVLEQEPDSPRALRAVADLAMEAGDRDQALAALRRILTTARDDAARRDAAGRILGMHRRSGLDQLLKEEEARAAEDPSAHYLLARAAMLRRRSTQAIRHLEALVRSDPTSELGRTDLARLYTETGKEEDAIRLYEELMQSRPASRGVWLRRLASLHTAERRKRDAVRCYEEVLDLTPDNAAVFAEVAGKLDALGESERALACVRQAIRLRPDEGDYRLQLADLLVAQGDEDSAREQVRLALASDDPGTTEGARSWIHADLVEHGGVHAEVARLRDVLARSPYDQESSAALIDLWVRELEYALALDLIEDRLAFDPANVALLRVRAKLLEELGRYDQAIADHGTLLRLPGVGQDAVQLDLARCALRFGDRGRADAALLGVSDRVAVSQLYEREGLTEQAIGVLEEALVLNPGDWGLKQRLVRMYQKNGQVAKALDVHRGILAVRGEDWDSLRAQIDLCAAAGDEEGIRDAGARMLALTAAPVAPEGETSGVKVRRAVSVQRREHRKLLQEVWELYADRSKQQAFLDLVVERLKETPADEELLALALQACAPATEVFLDEPVEIEFSQAVAFVDLVRERTLGATPLLLPAGHSEASWLRELDRHEERLVKADPELAMRRVGQLAAVDFGELSGKDLDERLELLRAQGEPHEVLEVLELGVRRFPEEDKYRSGLAIRLLHDGESEAALPHLEALLAALDQEGERTARRPDDPGAEGRHAKTLLKRVPDEFADQRTDELGLTLYRLTRPSPLRGDWLESRVPNALDVRVALARCCHDLGRTEEAVAWLDEVMPNHLEFTEWAASTSDLYREFGQDERADAIDAQVWQVVQGVQASPVLRAGRAWQVGTRAAVMRELGGIEDPVERYELTRLWTGTSAAWSREHAETIRGAFAARWGAVRGEDSPEARDAGLLLAELLGLEDRWDEAIEIQRQLVELEPSDQDARAMLASYLVRAERAGEALALLDLELEEARKRYEETGERPARVARRILGAGATANPSELQPRPLALEGLRDRAREMVDEYDRSLSMFPVAQGPDLTPLRVQIFKLAWMAKDYARAGQELRAINDENPQLVAYCQWETKAALDEARLGADGVGLYAVLYDKSPGDSNLVESYGKALEEAGQNEDAIAVYRKYVQAQGNQSHYTLDQIRGSLERLTGAEAALLEEELPEDLVAAVAADPKSARLRIALIERLLRRGRTESAVEHALALEKLAPHLAEVPPLVERALLLAGDEGGLLERWNQRLATTTAVQGRIELAVRLADRAHAAGADAAELNDIFARAQLRGTFIEDDYTIASWWIINGFHDEARAQLLEDRKSGQEWYFSEIDAALALLPQAELTLESRFEPLLQTSPGDAVDAIERALFEHGDVTWAQLEPLCEEQSRGYHALYPAGFALYEGRHADAEALMVALALQDVRYKAQLPAAIRLATARGDHAAALSYLDRLEERYPTSDRRKIDTSLGPIGEAQLAGVTRANLLRELGQAGEADEVWRKTFGRTADSRRLGAHLALTVNLADLAAELLGDDQRDSLLRSRILRTTGDLEGELASLDTYLESVPGDDSEGNEQQTRRLMVLCELGRRDEARRELEARLVKDPGDVLAAKFLIHLTWEEGGADAVAAMLDEGSLDLRELDELPRWAAEFRRERGDLSGALAAYEIYAEMGEEWQRSNVARARADLLVRLGREDELVDLYLDGVSRSQALLLAAERLSQGGAAPELALSWRREAAALGLYSTVAQEVELRLEIGQQEEAHQTALAAAAGRASLNDLRSAYTLFAKHHDELRVELAADESDAAARARVALELAAGEHAAVLAGLERLEAAGLEPTWSVADQRWRALQGLGRFEEAAQVLRETIELFDRCRSVAGIDASDIDGLRGSLFRLTMRTAGAELAVDEAYSSLGSRMAPVDTDYYQLWYLDSLEYRSNRSRSTESWLLRCELYEELLRRSGAASESLSLARARTGDLAGALAGIVEEQRNDSNLVPGEGVELNSTQVELWARLLFEAGLDGHPLDADLSANARRQVEDALLGLEGRHVDLVAAAKARDAGPLASPSSWRAVGEWERIYDALLLARTRSPFADEVASPPAVSGIEELPFRFGNAQRSNSGVMLGSTLVRSFSSGARYYEHFESSARSGDHLDWIEACFRTGRQDQALAAQERELGLSRNRGWSAPGRQLAQRYLGRGLFEQAEGLHARCLEAEYPDPEARERERRLFDRQVLVAAGQAGATAVRDAALLRIEAVTPPTDAEERADFHWDRAYVFGRARLDAERVQAEVDRARDADPEFVPSRGRRAWIALDAGRSEEALTLFREELAEQRLGTSSLSSTQTGLALALHAVGDPGAEKDLRRALTEDWRGERADLLRAALGL